MMSASAGFRGMDLMKKTDTIGQDYQFIIVVCTGQIVVLYIQNGKNIVRAMATQ